MDLDSALLALWIEVRDRLAARKLLCGAGAGVSLRIPGSGDMWFGAAADEAPSRGADVPLHTAIYAARPDVGAIAVGGGAFGSCLADFGGRMPEVFDEQARHLGRMGQAVDNAEGGLARALRAGGNAVLMAGVPVCLGTTGSRLALNAELFEKCAKAYVLSAAAGGPIKPLPWWVRHIANGRLLKDEGRAAARWAQGLLPQESRGY
jgi:ribulose-5-phosphate 4-epimerase/fuculose-1-phosphate aldolase